MIIARRFISRRSDTTVKILVMPWDGIRGHLVVILSDFDCYAVAEKTLTLAITFEP